MKKRLLVIVDYQHDFVDGSLGFKDAATIEKVIINEINDFLHHHDDIVFTFDTHYDNYLETREGENLPVKHCIEGTAGHKLSGKVGDYLPFAKKVYYKNTFGSLELANDLKDSKYDEITFVGLVTNICILSNALLAKAALPEAEIIVIENGVNSYDKELHEKTLDVLRGTQISIIKK